MIFCILGSISAGIAIAETPIESPSPITAQTPNLTEGQIEVDLLLEILIRYLILTLEDPTLDGPPAPLPQINGDDLFVSTKELTLGYQAYGLVNDLAFAEKQGQVANAYDIIDLLDNHDDEIGLDKDTQVELRLTTELIIGELLNGQ